MLRAAEQIEELERATEMHSGGLVLIPLLESAKGVLNAREIAAANRWMIALAFGAVNFTRDMGSSPSADGTELLYA